MLLFKAVVKNVLDFLPLFLFLQIASLSKETGATKWILAYEVAAIGAFFHGIFLVSRKSVASRVALGVDAYLLIGGVASIFSVASLLQILNSAREFGLLLVICIVGIVATIFSPNGFIGCQNGTQSVHRYSQYLLAITFAAALLSYLYRGNPVLAGVIPVVAVVFANKVLLMKLKKCMS